MSLHKNISHLHCSHEVCQSPSCWTQPNGEIWLFGCFWGSGENIGLKLWYSFLNFVKRPSTFYVPTPSMKWIKTEIRAQSIMWITEGTWLHEQLQETFTEDFQHVLIDWTHNQVTDTRLDPKSLLAFTGCSPTSICDAFTACQLVTDLNLMKQGAVFDVPYDRVTCRRQGGLIHRPTEDSSIPLVLSTPLMQNVP